MHFYNLIIFILMEAVRSIIVMTSYCGTIVDAVSICICVSAKVTEDIFVVVAYVNNFND